MIIACPACATRYVVPDSAIGVDGRTVRCAKCRHSWFQDGPQLAFVGAEAPLHQRVTVVAPQPAPSRAEDPDPVPIHERATAFAPQPGVASAAEPEVLPPVADAPDPEPAVPGFAETAREPAPPPPWADAPSSFAAEPPFRPRRNPAKLWTAAAIAFAVVTALLIAAVSWWGLPGWLPLARPTFAAAQPDLVLEFPPERQDRRTLPNGTEFFGASGSVTNVGQESREVPPILIVLRDGRERIVYTWEVRAPKPELAPGESVTINEAVTDVPRSAKVAEIGWKPG